MKVADLGANGLKELIAEWLIFTRDKDLPIGLGEEEAVGRARELESLILAGRARTSDFILDDESKDVLCALVYVVLGRDGEDLRDLERRAAGVYNFIRAIDCPEEEREEQQELLNECFSLAKTSMDGSGSAGMPDGGELDRLAERVFDGSLPALRALLTDTYGLQISEAQELENDLRTWFVRFCRRPSSTPEKLRALLFAASSQFASALKRFASDRSSTLVEE